MDLKHEARSVLKGMFAPTLWLINHADRPFYFLVKTVPERLTQLAVRMEEKGEAMCYGPNAHRTMVPGILLREAGRLAQRPLRSGWGHLAWYGSALALSFGTGAVAAPGIAGMLLLGTALAPFTICATAVAGAGLLMAAGAAYSLLPALCNIRTGQRRRAEALERQEEARLNSWNVPEAQLPKLPPLERDMHAFRRRLMAATPDERTDWLGALKEKFPEDFARAAVPERAEYAEGLSETLRLERKKPICLKKPGKKKLLGAFHGMLRR